MKQTLSEVSMGINKLVNEVRDFVKKNGGFVSTHNSDLDTMYAYIVDWEYDNVTEERIIAIRVYENELEIATTPFKTDVYTEPLTNEDFENNDWYVVGTNGDSVLTAQTILSIAECIHEYVE